MAPFPRLWRGSQTTPLLRPKVSSFVRGASAMRRFWQPTRYPIVVRTERFWKQKLDYIHANPVRKGLVQYPEDWRSSSARYYATGNSEGNDVNITQITW